MWLSIIIPVLNEEKPIQALLAFLNAYVPETEIIVVDGGSKDGTQQKARENGVRLITLQSRGRAVQMNEGAREASGYTFYFLHADTFPPKDFVALIQNALKKGYQAGAFRLSFNIDHWFLNAFAWFTRFNFTPFRFGDQSLFVTKEAFESSGGFNEDLVIMEDQEMARRLKRQVPFTVIQKPVTTSVRKYQENGIFYQQGLYILVYFLYYLGMSQDKLRKWVNR